MKILIIGLDAATMDLVEPWSSSGQLPNLARLIREGASGRMLSTPNMHSASAWTSILTGLNPGRHGLFVFSDRDFVTGKQVFFKGGDRIGELIDAHLSRSGLTSGFLNVPMTYPARCQPGGFMISGLDAPSLNDRAFSPAELRAEIFDRSPSYAFSPPDLGEMMRAGRLEDAVKAWLDLIEIQTAAAEYLIETRPTDFFMTVYTASDWGGHNLWNDLSGSTGENPLLKIYRELDTAIGRLLEKANAANVFVISDHGMGAHTGASYHLAEWLELNGYMTRSGRTQPRHSIISASRRVARSLLPESVKEIVKSRIGLERVERLQSSEKDSFYSSVDWARTRAYTEPGRHVININLKGRNPDGIIPQSDYLEVCERIIDDLNLWRDDRGERVVERVVRRDEVYHGPFSARASDLHVYWNSAARFEVPPQEVQDRGFWWTGDHRPEGILICKGESVKPTRFREMPTVCDLLPTVMYATGLSIPKNLDGNVVREVFSREFLEKNLVRFESSAASDVGDEVRLSAEEEKIVEEKLRGLGYL